MTTFKAGGLGEGYFEMADRGYDAMRKQGHVRNAERSNPQHYAAAMVGPDGELKPDCFLVTDPKWNAAYYKQRNELQEISPNQPCDPATVIQRMIATMDPSSHLALRLYEQAKYYGLEKEVITVDRQLPKIKPVEAEPLREDTRARYMNSEINRLQQRREMAHSAIDAVVVDTEGSIKPDSFVKKSAWTRNIEQARQRLSGDLGLLKPPSDANVLHHMIDNDMGSHTFREFLITNARKPQPKQGPKTHVAHVTDDPEVAAKILGGPQR